MIYYSTGKKKTSIAKVYIKSGNYNIFINNIDIDNYCKNNLIMKNIIIDPLNKINDFNFNINVKVKGGGLFGQVYAIRHGISKALVVFNKDYKSILKKYGFITRDSRKVERKKVGFKKSRKKPQFSKR